MKLRITNQILPLDAFRLLLRSDALLFCGCALIFCSCAIQPTDEEILRLYANAKSMYTEGRFSETAELLTGVKKFFPALVLRAKAEYFSGALIDAEKSCRQAIKMRPPAYEARLYLARILRDRGETIPAGKITESLLADNPQEIRTLRLASSLAWDRGDLAEASALLDQAADISAESAMVLLDRARLRWIAGRGTEALEDLSRSKAMLPWDTVLVKSIEHLETRIKETLQK